jgi:hypothetical protein
MNDRRDPRIMALVIELAESAPPAPSYHQLEEVIDADAEAVKGIGDDLTVDYLPRRDESSGPRKQGRWVGAVLAVAAILVVVGVVVADRNSGEVVTSQASSSVDELLPASEPSGVPEDRSVFGGGSMRSVIAVGPGLVAVGSSTIDAPVWTSVDGITWSRVPSDEIVFAGQGEPPGMSDMTVGGPGLVAVGAGGTSRAAAWTSVDGITWNRAGHDEEIFGGVEINSVAAGGPGLVAVGNDGMSGRRDAAAWTSVDGTTWSRVPHDEAVFGGSTHVGMADVIAGGPGLVAVGVGLPNNSNWQVAVVWTSVDGLTWSRVPHDDAVFGETDTESGQWAGYVMESVPIGGPGLVAIGWESSISDTEANAAVWTSIDGITWTRVPHDDEIFGGPGPQRMTSVTTGGPGLVAVGNSGTVDSHETDAAVWTSVDGITWTRVPHDDEIFGRADLNSVTDGGPGLVAVGNDGFDSEDAAVWTSVDGITWSRVTDDEAG